MILTAFHLIICIFLIIIVLLQQGRGADMGATFGGGSNTLFGASGADNLLTKITAITALLFMLTSLALTHLGRSTFVNDSELFQNAPAVAPTVEVPATAPAAGGPVAESAGVPSSQPVGSAAAPVAVPLNPVTDSGTVNPETGAQPIVNQNVEVQPNAPAAPVAPSSGETPPPSTP